MNFFNQLIFPELFKHNCANGNIWGLNDRLDGNLILIGVKLAEVVVKWRSLGDGGEKLAEMMETWERELDDG